MANHFTVKIKLGNDAMRTKRDVARALRIIAQQLEDHADYSRTTHHMSYSVSDVNGNRVGEWTYKNDEEE